ncbi:hypothetical protein [Serratia fonticola]
MTIDIDKEISKHNLEAYGWKMGEFNHSTPFDSHVIYIRDFRYKHQQLFCVSQKDFYQLKIKEDIQTDECVNFISQIMKKQGKKDKLDEVETRAIVPILVHYIKITRVYAQWRNQASPDDRLHMVLNIYSDGKAKPDSVRLRPFIVLPDAVMLTADEFMEYTTQVYNTDRKNHPEWFR